MTYDGRTGSHALSYWFPGTVVVHDLAWFTFYKVVKCEWGMTMEMCTQSQCRIYDIIMPPLNGMLRLPDGGMITFLHPHPPS